MGDFSEFPYSWYMKDKWRQHFGFENWKTLIEDIKEKMSYEGWFHDRKYHARMDQIYDFLRYVEDPKFIKRIRSHIPRVNALFEATKNYGFLIGKWPELIGAVNQKKRVEGKFWVAKISGVPVLAREDIAESVTKLVEEIEDFINFSEGAFKDLDKIEENLSGITNSAERERLIKKHDEILDYIDEVIDILESKISKILD